MRLWVCSPALRKRRGTQKRIEEHSSPGNVTQEKASLPFCLCCTSPPRFPWSLKSCLFYQEAYSIVLLPFYKLVYLMLQKIVFKTYWGRWQLLWEENNKSWVFFFFGTNSPLGNVVLSESQKGLWQDCPEKDVHAWKGTGRCQACKITRAVPAFGVLAEGALLYLFYRWSRSDSYEQMGIAVTCAENIL